MARNYSKIKKDASFFLTRKQNYYYQLSMRYRNHNPKVADKYGKKFLNLASKSIKFQTKLKNPTLFFSLSKERDFRPLLNAAINSEYAMDIFKNEMSKHGSAEIAYQRMIERLTPLSHNEVKQIFNLDNQRYGPNSDIWNPNSAVYSLPYARAARAAKQLAPSFFEKYKKIAIWAPE